MNPTLRNIISHPWLIFVLRFVLGFVFVYAAIEKISQPEEFAKAIANYHLLPLFSLNVIALTVPWMELLAGFALIGGVHVRGSSLLLGVLIVVFTLAVSVALLRGLDISCGCFGTASVSKVGWTHLFENLAMLGGCLVIYFKRTQPPANA